MIPFIFQALALSGVLNYSKSKLSSEEEYLTTKDASKILQLTEYTVRKKIRDGELNAEVIPGKKGYRIKKFDLDNYKSRNQRSSQSTQINSNITPNVTDIPFSQIIGAAAVWGITNINPDSEIDTSGIQNFIDGKKQDLKGLNLRKQKLLLQNDSSEKYEKAKLDLEIEISDLEAEIKAYELLLTNAKFMNKKIVSGGSMSDENSST